MFDKRGTLMDVDKNVGSHPPAGFCLNFSFGFSYIKFFSRKKNQGGNEKKKGFIVRRPMLMEGLKRRMHAFGNPESIDYIHNLVSQVEWYYILSHSVSRFFFF